LIPALDDCTLGLFKLYAEGCNLLVAIYNISSTLMCESLRFCYLLFSLWPVGCSLGIGFNDYYDDEGSGYLFLWSSNSEETELVINVIGCIWTILGGPAVFI